MDQRLKSLIAALPTLPAREDETLEQVADLVQIAEKLGMAEAVEYLNSQLAFASKWGGPKPLHPEQLSGEIHLLNSDPETVRYIGWKSKRAGTVAYDVDNKIEPGKVPVFISADEFDKAGQLTSRYTVAP